MYAFMLLEVEEKFEYHLPSFSRLWYILKQEDYHEFQGTVGDSVRSSLEKMGKKERRRKGERKEKRMKEVCGGGGDTLFRVLAEAAQSRVNQGVPPP